MNAVLNVELLDRVMEWVEQSNEKQEMIRAEKGTDQVFYKDMIRAIGTDIWLQQTWRVMTPCGTALCFAGATCELSGAQWDVDGPYTTTIDGEVAGEVAQRLLGLNAEEADALFYSGNTVELLREVLDKIKAGDYR